ncbi:mediator of RNA polymerase II transcription subunit 12-like protein isoform X2 [Oscarella lobularis]|uniref:mediator of RNA polymerase II transcription subunit 12-like protein isoform X2 n=1 Tax=Oscarella lobularis TaxID=121494 RepID=UPI0033136869
MGSRELRPLKKQKFGPPDIFRQDPNQEEDRLNDETVTRGFRTENRVQDETSSAASLLANPIFALSDQVKNSFDGILKAKRKYNTFQDTSKRKLQLNQKEHFLFVTPKTKNATLGWFQSLAQEKFPLSLSRKIPIFNKKEEILDNLCDHSVPMLRAAWCIKICEAAASETKSNKKRPAGDASREWTGIITRYLKDVMGKLTEYYSSAAPASVLPGSGSFFPQSQKPALENALKQWSYVTQLAQHMYQEFLLNRHDFLTWLIDQMRLLKSEEEGVLKLLLPQALKYLPCIVKSQYLSRSLAFVCCRHLVSLCFHEEESFDNGTLRGNTDAASGEDTASKVKFDEESLLVEYKNCSYHRNLVLSLSSLLQTVTLGCPSALVYMPSPIGSIDLMASGNFFSMATKFSSPLDILPLAPSELPFSEKITPAMKDEAVSRLVEDENEICQRSLAAEKRWKMNVDDHSEEARTVDSLLSLLEDLDKFEYGKAGLHGSVEELYGKIFTENSRESWFEFVIPLLCDWAVNAYSGGLQRVFIVARLLHVAQARLHKPSPVRSALEHEARDAGDGGGEAGVRHEMDGVDDDDDDDGVSVASLDCLNFPFRDKLMLYLDSTAPYPLADEGSSATDSPFQRFVVLFGELIRTGVFSYHTYLSTLISRGDLQATPNQGGIDGGDANATTANRTTTMTMELFKIGGGVDGENDETMETTTTTAESQSPPPPPSLGSKRRRSDSENQDSFPPTKVALIGDVFGGSLDDLSPSSDSPDSPTAVTMATTTGTGTMANPSLQRQPSTARHFSYALNFPIPEEMCSEYFTNQRLVVLYGVGRQRDEAMEKLQLVTDEVCQHLADIDEQTPGSVVYQTSHDDAVKSFMSATHFHRSRVIHTCREKILGGGGSGKVTRYKNVSSAKLEFVIELMELYGDVNAMLELVEELLIGESLYESSNDDDDDVERGSGDARKGSDEAGVAKHGDEGSVKGSSGEYVVSLKLVPCLLSVLRKYRQCVLLSQRCTEIVFEGLYRVVKNASNLSSCKGVERSVLVFLYSLYTSCEHLKVACESAFGKKATEVRESVFSVSSPARTDLKPNASIFPHLQDPRTVKAKAIFSEIRKDPANLHGFVYRIVTLLCQEQTTTRLQGFASLCVKAIARCKGLSAEFLGALRAMACIGKEIGYTVLMRDIDFKSPSVQDQIANFTAILVAQSAFSLKDVLTLVVQPSLQSARLRGESAEQGVRLTCQLLTHLLTERDESEIVSKRGLYSAHHQMSGNVSIINAADRRCLQAAREELDLGTIFNVIKMLLKLNAAAIGVGGRFSTVGNMTLTAQTLASICHQPWMKALFLGRLEALRSDEMLMDLSFVASEALCLLQLVCHPDGSSSHEEESPEDAAQRILEHLNQWNFQTSFLELQLLIRQFQDDPTQHERILNTIAQCVSDVFWSPETHCTPGSASKDVVNLSNLHVWLVVPLISQLPPTVQGALLQAAGEVLNRENWWKPNPDKNIDSTNPLAVPWQKPFLALVMSCLKVSEDVAKADVLNSLRMQMAQFIACPDSERHSEEEEAALFAFEALRLRLSLMGAMFDTLLRNTSLCGEWCVILMQLLTSQTVTKRSNYSRLFTMVFDMLSCLLADGRFLNEQPTMPTSDEPGRKASIPILKRLKEAASACTDKRLADECQALLRIPQPKIRIQAVEDFGSAEGSKSSQGYLLCGDQFLDPWEVFEGSKNVGPLSWSLFGAVRHERRPNDRYDEEFLRTRHHINVRSFEPFKVRVVVPSAVDSGDDEDNGGVGGVVVGGDGGDGSDDRSAPTDNEVAEIVQSAASPIVPGMTFGLSGLPPPTNQGAKVVAATKAQRAGGGKGMRRLQRRISGTESGGRPTYLPLEPTFPDLDVLASQHSRSLPNTPVLQRTAGAPVDIAPAGPPQSMRSITPLPPDSAGLRIATAGSSTPSRLPSLGGFSVLEQRPRSSTPQPITSKPMLQTTLQRSSSEPLGDVANVSIIQQQQQQQLATTAASVLQDGGVRRQPPAPLQISASSSFVTPPMAVISGGTRLMPSSQSATSVAPLSIVNQVKQAQVQSVQFVPRPGYAIVPSTASGQRSSPISRTTNPLILPNSSLQQRMQQVHPRTLPLKPAYQPIRMAPPSSLVSHSQQPYLTTVVGSAAITGQPHTVSHMATNALQQYATPRQPQQPQQSQQLQQLQQQVSQPMATMAQFQQQQPHSQMALQQLQRQFSGDGTQ